VGPVRGHRRPGPLERAVDRDDRHVEQLAVSFADQSTTSRRIRTARWRGGSSWTAARNASSIVSRETATACGSSSGGAISSSSRSG
jgi:hypothetical protein